MIKNIYISWSFSSFNIDLGGEGEEGDDEEEEEESLFSIMYNENERYQL